MTLPRRNGTRTEEWQHFLLIVVAVMLARPGRYDEAARIPLDDDSVRTPRDDPHARNGVRPAAADPDGGAR